MVRVIYVVHTSAGRTRLRLPWLRRAREEAEPLADKLSALNGMEQVEVKPFTGSILCLHDPELSVERILAEICTATGVRVAVREGEASTAAEEAELARVALEQGSDVARALSGFFKGLNVEVLRRTEGRIDLGTLAAFGFATAGAAEVVASGKLPLPPWFQLGWWAFRTFTTMEKRAIENTSPEMEGEATA